MLSKVKFLLFILPFVLACSFNETSESREAVVPYSFDTIKSEVGDSTKSEVHITYHLRRINDSLLNDIKSKYSDKERGIILSLNRVDLKHLSRIDTLIVPDIFLSDVKEYSPFPENISELKEISKLVLFAYSIQAFAVYENGCLIRWGPVSMGRRMAPTPNGLFHTNWKAKRTVSTVNAEWIMNWYFNIDNFKGVSMHEYDLPGYPASHGCIRLLEEDAMWLYEWCESWTLDSKGNIAAYGTPVVIFGHYAFGERKPWLKLAENNQANKLSREDLTREIRRFLPIIFLKS